jgi:hypothetical protein
MQLQTPAAAQMTLGSRSACDLHCLHACLHVCMKCEPLGDQLFTRRSNAVVSSLADSLDPRLTAVPAPQLDFADAPMLFYGTSRAFALVSDNGYVAFDYTVYPYDPSKFGTDDLDSPKVCTCMASAGSPAFKAGDVAWV